MAISLRKRIAQAAQMACLLEVSASKPGNINRYHDFADSRYEDYLLSAVAIGPALEGAGRVPVGRTILRAVRDTRQVVSSNTNLGMILLLAPLAKAAFQTQSSEKNRAADNMDPQRLRDRLTDILSSLTIEDARLAYRAIRLTRPGGIGKVPQADVAEEPQITLYQAMQLAQAHDSIAREYSTGFSITFEIGLPALTEALQSVGDLSAAIVQAYLIILSRVPDTLIARKRGAQSAEDVSQRAAEALDKGGVLSARGKSAVEELDRYLRDETHSLNPGTTADLIAAVVFAHLLLDL